MSDDASVAALAGETDTTVTFVAGDLDPSSSRPFAVFSNWYPCTLTLFDKQWASSEHCFQAQKFPTVPDFQEKIRAAPDASTACAVGRDRAQPLRPDWETVKLPLMEQVLEAKFGQNPGLAATLLATGDKEIIEHHSRDGFWGNGGDGSGQNNLGKILMKVRATLRARAAADAN